MSQVDRRSAENCFRFAARTGIGFSEDLSNDMAGLQVRSHARRGCGVDRHSKFVQNLRQTLKLIGYHFWIASAAHPVFSSTRRNGALEEYLATSAEFPRGEFHA